MSLLNPRIADWKCRYLRTAPAIALIALAIPLGGQNSAHTRKKEQARKERSADLPAVVWHDPGDVSRLNLFFGAGGEKDAPDPKGGYTFLREVLTGANPKFDVEDKNGVRWRVKVGSEANAETAATRILWAAGYYVDEDYYLTEINVEGLKKIRRGSEYVNGHTVQGARLERRLPSRQELGPWRWARNPLAGTKEMNGLRVLMALINNYDLKYLNNSVYVTDRERLFVVSDVGASFGRTGPPMNRSENKLEDYAQSRFVDKVRPEYVDFVMHTRPIPPLIVLFPMYIDGVERQHVAKHIPRGDVRWLAHLLSQLSDAQLRDCFAAAGYSPEKIDGFTRVIERRIAELQRI